MTPDKNHLMIFIVTDSEPILKNDVAFLIW